MMNFFKHKSTTQTLSQAIVRTNAIEVQLERLKKLAARLTVYARSEEDSRDIALAYCGSRAKNTSVKRRINQKNIDHLVIEDVHAFEEFLKSYRCEAIYTPVSDRVDCLRQDLELSLEKYYRLIGNLYNQIWSGSVIYSFSYKREIIRRLIRCFDDEEGSNVQHPYVMHYSHLITRQHENHKKRKTVDSSHFRIYT